MKVEQKENVVPKHALQLGNNHLCNIALGEHSLFILLL